MEAITATRIDAREVGMNERGLSFILSKGDIAGVFQVFSGFLFATSTVQLHVDIHQGMGNGCRFTDLLCCGIYPRKCVERLSIAPPLDVQNCPDTLSVGALQ